MRPQWVLGWDNEKVPRSGLEKVLQPETVIVDAEGHGRGRSGEDRVLVRVELGWASARWHSFLTSTHAGPSWMIGSGRGLARGMGAALEMADSMGMQDVVVPAADAR